MTSLRAINLLICGLLLATVPAPIATLAVGTDLVWDVPRPMATDLSLGWFPEISADPAGEMRLVWQGSLPGDTTTAQLSQVLFSQLEGETWSVPASLAVGTAGQAVRTAIASDGTWVHILYRHHTPARLVRLYHIRAPARSDLGNAHSWSKPTMLSEDNVYYSQISVLPDGTLLANYNQMANPPGSGATRYRMTLFSRRSSDDGLTWGRAVRVSDNELPVVRNTVAYGLASDVIIAAWDEGYENQSGEGRVTHIATAVSSDGGQSWSARQAITSPRGPIEQAVVVIGGAGAVLAYRSTRSDRLLYRVSGDGGRTWSEEREVDGAILRPYNGMHHFDRFSMAVDGDGRPLLAFVGRDASAPKQLAVWVTTYGEGGWGAPSRVAAPDGYPEYPRLAVALGNQLHLAYFVRNQEFDATYIGLWVASGRSDARAIAPVAGGGAALPTPVPLAVPAVRIVPPPEVPDAPSPVASAPAPPLVALVSDPPRTTLLATLAALPVLVLLSTLVRRAQQILRE